MIKNSKVLDVNSKHSFVQDNRLITAQYSRNTNIIGQKLVRLAIANIDSVNDADFFTYTIDVASILKLLKIKNDNIYRDLQKASDELLETKILIQHKDKKRGFKKYNLFSDFDYNGGQGTITICFNPKMKEFLLQLKKNFTQIPLEQIIFMKHKYSIRMYELLKMKLQDAPVYADNHSKVELTVEEIRVSTNTLKIYKQPSQLREKVITPAIEDIEQFANLHCEFKNIKLGRSVVGYEFDIWSANGWKHRQNELKTLENSGFKKIKGRK